jgi:putative Ca2+/H+ antiporter (TMEM165/GDT1 family)
MSIGLAEIPVLVGISLTFVTAPSLWMILVGLLFAALGLWMIAPGPSNISREQERISQTGSLLSLLQSLDVPPGGTT